MLGKLPSVTGRRLRGVPGEAHGGRREPQALACQAQWEEVGTGQTLEAGDGTDRQNGLSLA